METPTEELEVEETRPWLWWVAAICIGTALAVALCVVAYKIRLIVVLFAAGFVVAYIFDPWLDKLEARGWSRSRAVWTVMGSMCGAAGLLALLLVPRVVGEVSDAAENWTHYSTTATRMFDTARESVTGWVRGYLPDEPQLDQPDEPQPGQPNEPQPGQPDEPQPGQPDEPQPDRPDEPQLDQLSQLNEYIDRQIVVVRAWADAHKADALKWLGSVTLQVAGAAVFLVLVAIVSFHFMLIIDPMRDTIHGLYLSETQSQEVDETVVRVNKMLGAYVRGMAAVSLLVGAATAVALSCVALGFGTRYSLALGLLAGVTYGVPYLGQTVSAGAACFFALVTADEHSVIAAVVAGVVVVAVNQIADNVAMPRIVGEKVGLHPLVVLFACLAGYSLGGIIGVLIAVPVAASIRIALRRWLPVQPDEVEDGKDHLPKLDAKRAIASVRDSVRQLLSSKRIHPAGVTRGTPAEAETDVGRETKDDSQRP